MNDRRPQRPAQSRLRIVVLGYVVRGPLGGMVTSNLHYLVGLMQLGHEVYFVEDSDDYVSCYDPSIDEMTTDPSYGLKFAAHVFARIGLGRNWAYYDAHTARWLGPHADRMERICESADLVLNLCGVNPLRPWLMRTPVRVLVDEDPAFHQIRHLVDEQAHERARAHTHFFSFGENVARGASIPDDGFPWQPTRPPIVLDAWPRTPARPRGKFTTIMQWESYPAREYDGRLYGMKSQSFRPYVDLPRRCGPVLEIAISGLPPQVRDTLLGNGWSLRPPMELSRDPWTYRAFIEWSKAEFSIAKHGFVVSHCGWFSERSACYLASGRPVVLEDTGFSDWLPCGTGVVAFSTPGEAAAAIEDVNTRYAAHCEAARSLAEEYFDSRRILADLLERSFASASSTPGELTPTTSAHS